MMERTAGIEPAFSTPITVHRFVAGVGYVRVLARRRGFQPRSPSLRRKCPDALDDRPVEWLPAPDSDLDWQVNSRASCHWRIGKMVDRRGTAPRATILQGSSAPLCAARALSWFRSTLSCSSGRRFHQISLQGELERPVGYDP